MANIFKEKRVYVEKHNGKDFTHEDASKLMWDEMIRSTFQLYKSMDKTQQKENKAKFETRVQFIVGTLGYPGANVKLTSKGFEILSGHKKVVARGNGGALYTITWDDEQ